MSLLGFEGFDHIAADTTNLLNMPFGTSAVQTGLWATAGFNNTKAAGLLGGFGISRASGSSSNFQLQLFNNYATLIIGFRYQVMTSIVLTDIIQFNDGGTSQCGISINAARKLIFWRGTNATILATGTTTLVAGGWYMIDVTVTINNTTGAIAVNLGGVAEINATGLNTRVSANNQTNIVQLNFTLSPQGIVFDDFYAEDTTGPSPYNAPLGVIRAETSFGVANNSVTWTPLTSTNVSQIQEVNMDSDTSYNFNSTTGIDTFTHGALSSTPVTIFAVDIIASARKTDVTAVNYRTKLISGATTQNGTTSALATVYQYVRDSYQNDPNTGSPWTGTAVNATDIGYEKF